MASSTTAAKTVAFFGASTGIGLSALKHTLAAGHQCVALCRYPAKLTAIFGTSETTPNLRIVEGNAHDSAAVSKCLVARDGVLVDAVISSIGAKPALSKGKLIDDANVCAKGMQTLVAAVAELRRSGAATGSPTLVGVSSTGISNYGRDTPALMVPLYRVLLKVPHQDKKIMEDTLIESGETFTVIRASWLTDGESTRTVRAGIEDPKAGREVSAIGYTISREDAGKWIADNIVISQDPRYINKIATITY